MNVTAELYRRVCDVLFDERDPIGVNGVAPRDEYDSYAWGLIAEIVSGGDETAVSNQLSQIARVSMCLTHINEERDHRVARRLIALVRGW